MTRLFRRLLALTRSGLPLSRQASALGLATLLVFLALIPVAIAQSSRRPATGLQAAARAVMEGRYDEALAIVGRLDERDPAVVAVKARALVARGRYQEAEAALTPAAERAPSGEAALELGLLLQRLGRSDAASVLARVAVRASVASDAAELARAARALYALGRVEQANAAFRDAAAAAPGDAAINSAWVSGRAVTVAVAAAQCRLPFRRPCRRRSAPAAARARCRGGIRHGAIVPRARSSHSTPSWTNAHP